MIPLADFQVKRSKKDRPIVLWVLIGLCLLIWLYQVTLSTQGTEYTLSPSMNFTYRFGAVPAEIVGQEIPQGFPTAPIAPILTLITSIFLHGGWSHVIFNMLYLWVFGDNIEDRFGHFGFLIFYLAGGVVANLVHILFALGSDSAFFPVIGASGAIAAVMGAYLALYPTARIRTLVIMFFITFVSIPAYWYLLIWFGMQFFGLIGSGSGVAWWAHIGGFVFGYLVAFIYLKIKYPHLPPPWTVFFKKKRTPNVFTRFGKSKTTGGFRDLGDGNGDGRVNKKSDEEYDIWRR